MPIFTSDKDFLLYGKLLPIILYQPRASKSRAPEAARIAAELLAESGL